MNVNVPRTKRVYLQPMLFSLVQLSAVAHENLPMSAHATRLAMSCPIHHHQLNLSLAWPALQNRTWLADIDYSQAQIQGKWPHQQVNFHLFQLQDMQLMKQP